MTNSVDPDQTATRLLHEGKSDLGLHCSIRTICLNIYTLGTKYIVRGSTVIIIN